MKAVRIHQFGGPEVLTYEDVPDPKPRKDQVLIRVRACSVNHLDIFVRGGLPGVNLPHIMGSDIAGGPSLSMFRQMGEALNSANVESSCLSPEGALYLATLGGAAVLGLDDRIGSFAPNKDADFIVVDYNSIDPLSGKGHYNDPVHVLSRLCYNGNSSCVKDVYIQGLLSRPLQPS